jgi:Mce-associated membrane protein
MTVTRDRLLVGGLVLALVAALVAVVLLWRDRDRDDADDRAESSAVLVDAAVAAEKEARDVVTRMTTYSFRTVEDDFSWVDDAGTENFQRNFADASKDAIALIRSLKATAAGSIVDSSATAADADHVKVLLFVDQRIRSQGEKGSKLDQPRVTLQMVRQDGEWLVDEVQVNNLISDPGAH